MRVLAAAIILALLAACASDPRYKQGLEWVTWQEQERQRMEAQGFPQYGPGY
jgi:outer membrane biogenesis lipoprotein LolB